MEYNYVIIFKKKPKTIIILKKSKTGTLCFIFQPGHVLSLTEIAEILKNGENS